MRNTEQPQIAQYNWRTSGAVSHIKKEKTNMNNTQKIRKLEARITQLCDCLSCKDSRAEGHGRIVNYHIREVI